MSKKITSIYFYCQIVFPSQKKIIIAHLCKDLCSKLRADAISQSNLFSAVSFNKYNMKECNLPKESNTSVQVMKGQTTAFVSISKTVNSLLIVGG